MKKYFWIGLFFILFFTLIYEFLFHHESHFHYWFNNIPIFWILFGFLGGCFLILFAKKILAWVVYKEEDYYQ